MKERKQPETLRLRSAVPAFTVGDIGKTIAWYTDILGFVLVEEHRNKDQLVGASLKAGDVSFTFFQDDFAKGKNREKGAGFRMYCETNQEIDQIAADIKERGGRLVSEPTDQPWGTRDFAVEDPDGFKISISSRLEKG